MIHTDDLKFLYGYGSQNNPKSLTRSSNSSSSNFAAREARQIAGPQVRRLAKIYQDMIDQTQPENLHQKNSRDLFSRKEAAATITPAFENTTAQASRVYERQIAPIIEKTIQVEEPSNISHQEESDSQDLASTNFTHFQELSEQDDTDIDTQERPISLTSSDGPSQRLSVLSIPEQEFPKFLNSTSFRVVHDRLNALYTTLGLHKALFENIQCNLDQKEVFLERINNVLQQLIDKIDEAKDTKRPTNRYLTTHRILNQSTYDALIQLTDQYKEVLQEKDAQNVMENLKKSLLEDKQNFHDAKIKPGKKQLSQRQDIYNYGDILSTKLNTFNKSKPWEKLGFSQ